MFAGERLQNGLRKNYRRCNHDSGIIPETTWADAGCIQPAPLRDDYERMMM